jgi:hypothetical protein
MSPSTDSRENRQFASELKFVVGRPLADQIRAWARARLQPDPNAGGDSNDVYQISSLYFDTEQYDVFHRKGSFGRSKYRIRRYGPSQFAFLERKLKTRGLVSKRRSLVSVDELNRLAADLNGAWPGSWYHRRLLARRLRPVCQISYNRTARVAKNEHGIIRLTVDENVRAVPIQGLGFNGHEAGTPLVGDPIIVELKYVIDLPALFKQLVEEFALNPQPISKYRLAVVALGFVPEPIPPQPAKPDSAACVCLTS